MQANNEIKINDMFTESDFGNGVFVNCVCGSKNLQNKEKPRNQHLQTKKTSTIYPVIKSAIYGSRGKKEDGNTS